MTASQTTRFEIWTWSAGTDPFTRNQMKTSHDNLEARAARCDKGSARPAAAAQYDRGFFIDTDSPVAISFCDGTTWYDIPNLESSLTPETLQAGGVGTAGSSIRASKANHNHPLPVGTAVGVGTENNAGGALTVSRSDHGHRLNGGAVDTFTIFASTVVGATTAAVTTTASPGVAESFSRSDHVHILAAGAVNTIDKSVVGIRPPTASGSTPGSPEAGDLWSDTSAKQLKQYSGGAWNWLGGKPLMALVEGSDAGSFSPDPIDNNVWSRAQNLGYSEITNTGGFGTGEESIVVGPAGIYQIVAMTNYFSVSSTGNFDLAYVIGNGQTVIDRGAQFAPGSTPIEAYMEQVGGAVLDAGFLSLSGTDVRELQAGDRITVLVRQGSTGDGDVSIYRIRLSVTYLGPAS